MPKLFTKTTVLNFSRKTTNVSPKSRRRSHCIHALSYTQANLQCKKRMYGLRCLFGVDSYGLNESPEGHRSNIRPT